MSDLIWLSEAQMRRIEPCFPLSHGVPRVDDRRIISGIILVIRNGLRWRDALHVALDRPRGDVRILVAVVGDVATDRTRDRELGDAQEQIPADSAIDGDVAGQGEVEASGRCGLDRQVEHHIHAALVRHPASHRGEVLLVVVHGMVSTEGPVSKT